jgi:hypothetical protein
MTDYQRQLFSKLVDANWEADNTINSPFLRDLARNEYWRVKEELIEVMGKDEYNRYVDGMRQMFAPAKSN